VLKLRKKERNKTVKWRVQWNGGVRVAMICPGPSARFCPTWNKPGLDKRFVNMGQVQTKSGCPDLNPGRVRPKKFGQSGLCNLKFLI